MSAPSTIVRAAAVGLTLLAAGCAGTSRTRVPLTAVDEGRELLLAVDVRALVLSGAARRTDDEVVVPLAVAVTNKGLSRTIALATESFTLELPDGTRAPVVDAATLARTYHRQRVDLEATRPFEEFLLGRFGVPPFRYVGFDFFPLAQEGAVPRRSIDLPLGTVGWGLLYFRVPHGVVRGGKLLVHPTGSRETYVVAFAVP